MEISDDEKVQRILEGRCVECGGRAPKHLLSCSQLDDMKYMFGNFTDEYDITNMDTDYDEPF